jgi:hypothetical protein
MDIAGLFHRLEKTFTEPALGRTLFVLAALSLIVYLNHESGLIHHYDTSNQIQSIERLQESDQNGSISQSTIDSLETAVTEEMREQRSPLRAKLPTELVWWISTLVVPVFYFIDINLPGLLEIKEGGMKRASQAVVGGAVITAGLWAVGTWTIDASSSLLATVTLPAIAQLSVLLMLLIAGLIATSHPDVPNDPEDMEVSDILSVIGGQKMTEGSSEKASKSMPLEKEIDYESRSTDLLEQSKNKAT